jgi:hypothetical protein
VTSVVIRHSGSGSAIQIVGAATDPPAEFSVVSHPTWPVTLATGEQTSVGVKLAATTPGSYNGALVVSAAGCSDLNLGLTGTVAAPAEAGGGGGKSGGCGQGAAGLVALGAPLLALALRRRRRQG